MYDDVTYVYDDVTYPIQRMGKVAAKVRGQLAAMVG